MRGLLWGVVAKSNSIARQTPCGCSCPPRWREILSSSFSTQSAAGLLLPYLSQYGASVKLEQEQAWAAVTTALTEPAEVRKSYRQTYWKTESIGCIVPTIECTMADSKVSHAAVLVRGLPSCDMSCSFACHLPWGLASMMVSCSCCCSF